MVTPVPKCSRCKGWAFEPDVTPMANCTRCAGTGREPVAQAPLGELGAAEVAS